MRVERDTGGRDDLVGGLVGLHPVHAPVLASRSSITAISPDRGSDRMQFYSRSRSGVSLLVNVTVVPWALRTTRVSAVQAFITVRPCPRGSSRVATGWSRFQAPWSVTVMVTRRVTGAEPTPH